MQAVPCYSRTRRTQWAHQVIDSWQTKELLPYLHYWSGAKHSAMASLVSVGLHDPPEKSSQPTKAPTLICQKVLCSEANAASPSPHLRPSIMDVCFHFKKTNELFRWREDLTDRLLRSFRGRSRAAAHSNGHKRMFISLIVIMPVTQNPGGSRRGRRIAQ